MLSFVVSGPFSLVLIGTGLAVGTIIHASKNARIAEFERLPHEYKQDVDVLSRVEQDLIAKGLLLAPTRLLQKFEARFQFLYQGGARNLSKIRKLRATVTKLKAARAFLNPDTFVIDEGFAKQIKDQNLYDILKRADFYYGRELATILSSDRFNRLLEKFDEGNQEQAMAELIGVGIDMLETEALRFKVQELIRRETGQKADRTEKDAFNQTWEAYQGLVISFTQQSDFSQEQDRIAKQLWDESASRLEIKETPDIFTKKQVFARRTSQINPPVALVFPTSDESAGILAQKIHQQGLSGNEVILVQTDSQSVLLRFIDNVKEKLSGVKLPEDFWDKFDKRVQRMGVIGDPIIIYNSVQSRLKMSDKESDIEVQLFTNQNMDFEKLDFTNLRLKLYHIISETMVLEIKLMQNIELRERAKQVFLMQQ